MTNQKASVLACVTSQFDCDRIIKTARLLANDNGCSLRVLIVLNPTDNYAIHSEQIQYLHNISIKSDTDMTILFNKDSVKAISEFINQNNICRLVTGVADGKNSFLINLNKECPEIPITMITKDNRIYSFELCQCYS